MRNLHALYSDLLRARVAAVAGPLRGATWELARRWK
jgi:hypothetical protein